MNSEAARRSASQLQAVERPLERRWYAANSLWNTSIPATSRGSRQTMRRLSGRGRTPARARRTVLQSLGHKLHARDLLLKPRDADGARSDRRPTLQCVYGEGADPDRGSAGSFSEGHMAIATANGTEYDFHAAQHPNGPPKSSRYYRRRCSKANEWTAAKMITTNWIGGRGELRGSVRGSGTPEGAGTILPRDTQQPAGSTGATRWRSRTAAHARTS